MQRSNCLSHWFIALLIALFALGLAGCGLPGIDSGQDGESPVENVNTNASNESNMNDEEMVNANGDDDDSNVNDDEAANVAAIRRAMNDLLAKHIEDQDHNTTRFLVMSKEPDFSRRQPVLRTLDIVFSLGLTVSQTISRIGAAPT